MCYLLISPGAALRTLKGRAGSCRADCHCLFWQYGGHVYTVVQFRLGFGIACCYWGDRRVWPGLRCQCLIQTAAAAAATVRAQGCGPQQTSEEGEELHAALVVFAVSKSTKTLDWKWHFSSYIVYEYILIKSLKNSLEKNRTWELQKETNVLWTQKSVSLTTLTSCNTWSFLQVRLELGSW